MLLHDIARDGRTAVLGTYDFKAQKPNIEIVSLDSGQLLRTMEYDTRHRGQLRFSPDGKSGLAAGRWGTTPVDAVFKLSNGTWSDRVDDWFADAQVRPIDGVGHFTPLEAPEAFAALIRAEIVKWAKIVKLSGAKVD